MAEAFGHAAAMLALVSVVYWVILASFHRTAVVNASTVANIIASSVGERTVRVIAMPLAANPFQWQSSRKPTSRCTGLESMRQPAVIASLKPRPLFATKTFGTRRSACFSS